MEDRPNRCPNCGSEGDMFYTETDLKTANGQRGNCETYSCYNEECQATWEATYAYVSKEVR